MHVCLSSIALICALSAQPTKETNPADLVGKSCIVVVTKANIFADSDDCWYLRSPVWTAEKAHRLTIIDAEYKKGFTSESWLFRVRENKGKKSRQGWVWAKDVRVGR